MAVVRSSPGCCLSSGRPWARVRREGARHAGKPSCRPRDAAQGCGCLSLRPRAVWGVSPSCVPGSRCGAVRMAPLGRTTCPPTLLTARNPEQGKPSAEQEFLERGISKRLPLRRGQVVRAGGDSRLSWAGGGKLPGQFPRGQRGRVGPWGGSWSRRVGPRGGSAGWGVWGPARLPPGQRGSPE